METYEKIKYDFLNKHSKKSIMKVNTSSMDEYDSYHKEYVFEDGACFYEIMTPITENATVEVHGVKVEVLVKLMRIEYWSSDDSKSRYAYERY